jgi:DNA modification methylase
VTEDEFRRGPSADCRAWPAAKVAMRAIDQLVPYARNARTHSDEQVAQIAASVVEWGWTMPLLVDERGGLIAGHGRVLAARKLGITHVPTMVARGWSEAQKRAYVIADNKLTLNAGWNEELLRVELAELQGLDFDLGLTGFDGTELDALLAERTVGLTDPDDAPPLPETPVSRPGDVWTMGGHRLACGDCTEAGAVAKALAGVVPHLMVTDPPYGVSYDPDWRNRTDRANGKAIGARAVGQVRNDDRADWREAWALFPGSVAYVWHAGLFADVVAESLRACRFRVRAQIVWVKQRHVISRGHYHPRHEPCLYGVREDADDGWRFVPEHEVTAYAVRDGSTASWHGGRKQSTVWFIEHLKSDTGHGTQKPVLCMQRPIENNSSPGQAVYEPFAGSGTTLIACEMTGRACHALEIDPGYVDVAVQRWQAFTGKDATLDGDGRSFQQVAAERSASKPKPKRIAS